MITGRGTKSEGVSGGSLGGTCQSDRHVMEGASGGQVLERVSE